MLVPRKTLSLSFVRLLTMVKSNWDRSFPSIIAKNTETDAGVVSPVLFYLLGYIDGVN